MHCICKITYIISPKLANRSKTMVSIGYDMNTKGYWMFDPATWQVVVTRGAVFDEKNKWDWSKSPALENGSYRDTFMVKCIPFSSASETAKYGDQIEEHNSNIEPFFSNSPHTPNTIFDGWISKGSSSKGLWGERNIKNLYDATFPIKLEYLGLCLLGKEETQILKKP